MAVAIAPQDESARRLLEQSQAGLATTEGARRAAAPDCASPIGPDLDEAARRQLRLCLERRAGLLASFGSPQPLTDLARLDLAEDKPESAALLLTIAGTMGGGDSAMLGRALARSGNPCGAATVGSDPAWQEACSGIRSRRTQVERELRADLDGLDTAARLVAVGRIESLLGSGLDTGAAARRWRIDRRRGERALVDMEGLTARPGQEWTATHALAGAPEASGCAAPAMRRSWSSRSARIARGSRSRRAEPSHGRGGPAPLAWIPRDLRLDRPRPREDRAPRARRGLRRARGGVGVDRRVRRRARAGLVVGRLLRNHRAGEARGSTRRAPRSRRRSPRRFCSPRTGII
jgi:hypothetical protein